MEQALLLTCARNRVTNAEDEGPTFLPFLCDILSQFCSCHFVF